MYPNWLIKRIYLETSVFGPILNLRETTNVRFHHLKKTIRWKLDVLNDHFASVFTKIYTPSDQISSLSRSYPDITPLLIEASGVRSLLKILDPSKAQGPDGISARFLKETSEDIAPILTLIFNASLYQGKLPTDWKTLLWCQFLRKVLVQTPQIIDSSHLL